MNHPIYLDNHATTRVDDRVLAAMLPYFTEQYGNASSRQHEYGWIAEAAVEHARGDVAGLVGADKDEIVFTSGATESINLALKGLAEACGPRKNHLVTSVTEHRAVLDTCDRLEDAGFSVTRLPVDRFGMVDPEAVRSAITEKTFAVSIMAANNEIGTLAPVRSIGDICRSRGVLFHTDATQAAATIPLDVHTMGIDLLSMSGHKMYGPKGIGALYVRNGVRVIAQMDGGGHERGRRSGTLNVPAIVGFGIAASLAASEGQRDAACICALRDHFVALLQSGLDGITVNGHPVERLATNASLTFEGVKADRLMMAVKRVAMSSGSACSTASPEPSHVLRAIGLKGDALIGTVRFGLGRFTTTEEIETAAELLVEGVNHQREHQRTVAVTSF